MGAFEHSDKGFRVLISQLFTDIGNAHRRKHQIIFCLPQPDAVYKLRKALPGYRFNDFCTIGLRKMEMLA